MIDSDFVNWLIRTKKFSPRAARDVLSRYRRAVEFLNVEQIKRKDIDEVLYLLSKEKAFSGLSVSVKSQLRRSLRLRYEFSAL